MFNAILLGGDESVSAAVERLAIESKQVSVKKTLYRLPQLFEINQLLNVHEPELVFLDLSDWESAVTVAKTVHEIAPGAGIIGFGAGWERGREAQSASAGVTELLVSPVTLQKFQEGVERAIHKMRASIQENLFTFLPAKAGSGSTTIALNTAGYLADTSAKDALARKVLLIDGDMHSGVLSVLLNRSHRYSLRDALDNSSELDYSQWTEFVVRSHGMELLLSSRKHRAPLPSWSHYHELLDFAAARYDFIIVDLPEVVNDATVEIVRRANRVFVVCTPELPSLTLAPQRCGELRSRGIPADRINLVVNRWQPGDISAKDVEEAIGHTVSEVFGNDYGAVAKAANAHQLVDPGKKLGKSFAGFARKLVEARG